MNDPSPPQAPPPDGAKAMVAIFAVFFIGLLIGFVLGRAL